MLRNKVLSSASIRKDNLEVPVPPAIWGSLLTPLSLSFLPSSGGMVMLTLPGLFRGWNESLTLR